MFCADVLCVNMDSDSTSVHGGGGDNYLSKSYFDEYVIISST